MLGLLHYFTIYQDSHMQWKYKSQMQSENKAQAYARSLIVPSSKPALSSSG